MAEDKKSVLLYCDIIHTVEKLDDETAGKLFKHYLRYINDKDPQTNNIVVDIAFESIKQTLKRDLKKWEKRAERSRENGKGGGRPKKTQETQRVISKPRKPDSAIVSGSVIGIVKVKDIIKKVYSVEIHDCLNNCLTFFPDYLHPNTESKKNNWLDTIEKLNRIEKLPLPAIENIVKKTREDDFWSKNFLSITKLRKNNKDGVKFVVVFNEKIKSNGQQNGNRQSQGVTDEELAEIIFTKVKRSE